MRTLPPISLVVRHCPMMQKLRPLLGITFSPRAAVPGPSARATVVTESKSDTRQTQTTGFKPSFVIVSTTFQFSSSR